MLRKSWKFYNASREITIRHRDLVFPATTHLRSLSSKVGRKKIEDPGEMKASKEILKHFNEPRREFVLKMFPEKLLKKKKTPDDLYLASEETARKIADVLKKDLKPDATLIEVNPGLGLLTTHLINETKNDMLIFEPDEHFHPYINVIS